MSKNRMAGVGGTGRWKRWLATGLLLVSPWGMASEEGVDRLLVASGVDAQMPVFAEMVQGALAQNPALEEEERGVLQHVAMEMLRADVLYGYVRDSVQAGLKPGDRETLLLWYGSPLGERITQLELNGMAGDALPALRAAAEQLVADSARMNAAARLDALTGSTALGLALQEKAMLANHMAVEIAADPEGEIDTSALDAQLQQHRVAMQQMLEQQTLLSLAFTYRDLPLERLASYESFLATSASQRYQQSLRAGLLEGVDALLADWDAGVREYYRE